MNLVLNAVEAIGDAPGEIEIRTSVQEVDRGATDVLYEIGHVAPGRNVLLELRDTGAGIDPSVKPNIFDPFFTTKFTGRGLGLAAVSGIVRTLKGAVKVDSTPGHGTTVRVFLPGGNAPVREPVPTQELPHSILIVDDEEIVRHTAEVILSNHGFRVVVAENGQEAVDLYRRLQSQIALVLLDMTMPVLGGEEALRQLKMMRSDVPVIVSSGYDEQEALQRFGGQDIAGFIQKPYTARSLIQKVGSVLKAKR
jgi:CheY-like chemotaxis protein